ncbi:hypothetical protein [Larkinella arboricola]
MNKPSISLGKILSKLFPKSQKAISEKLSTDEFNDFVAEAGILQADDEGEVEPVAAVIETVAAAEAVTPAEPTAEGAADGEPASPDATDLTSTDYQAQVQTLQSQVTQLTADKLALTTERDTANQQVTDLQAQLKQKDEYVAQLKASINPLADDDASNGAGADDGLTDTDRQARANATRFNNATK